MFCGRFLEDSPTSHGFDTQRPEVYLFKSAWEKLSGAEKTANQCPSSHYSTRKHRLRNILRWVRTGSYVNAVWESYSVCLSIIKGLRDTLSCAWLRISRNSLRTENLETLSIWGTLRHLHRPNSEGVERTPRPMDRVIKRLQLWDSLPSG